MPAEVLRLTLPSRFDVLDEVVERTQAFVEARTDDEDLAYRVTLLASEAVTNAIEHGNALDEAKRAAYELWQDGAGFRFTVQDEGDGFDPGEVDDPLARENLLTDGGRGLFLMRELAASIAYEDGGRRVRVQVDPQPTDPAAE